MKELDFLRTSVQRLHHARWFNTHQTLVPMSIAEHHYMVAVITMLMLDDLEQFKGTEHEMRNTYLGNYDTLRTALLHDLEESVTGDMNAVIKRKNNGVRTALRAASESVVAQQVEGLPNAARLLADWRAENVVVKAADKLSMWLYAIEECDMGNGLMRQVAHTVAGWLTEMATAQAWLAPWARAVEHENFLRGISAADVRENWR